MRVMSLVMFCTICAAPRVIGAQASEQFDTSRLPAPSAGQVDFIRDIRPIFRANCYECHGPAKQKAGFRLDLRAAALAGGDQTVILPGDSAHSILIRNVSGLVETAMPPDKSKRLTTQQVSLLRAWIDQGANGRKARTMESAHLTGHS